MIKTLNQLEDAKVAERYFRKRDPEGRFIFNNVLMNGHAHMLEYLLENWVDAHASLPLTLEGNTTVLHQALCRAAFCKIESEAKVNGEGGLNLNNKAEEVQEQEETKQGGSVQKSLKKKFEAPCQTEQSFVKMIQLLLDAGDKLNGAGIDIDKQDRLGRTVLHLAA